MCYARAVERLPFDPSRIKGPASGPPAGPAKSAAGRGGDAPVLTVTQLASRIEAALKTMPTGIRVIGEMSGYRDRTHWYFDLKDADAVVNCVMFASAAKRVGFVPQNGQEVVVKGRVEFYAKGGKVSLLVDSMQPVGEGALDAAYRKLCEEIRARGWFAIERKRPLPVFPRCVAVVTSRTGAALQDVLVTMRRRCAAVDVLVVDCRVQGDGAAAEVAAAINAISEHAEQWNIDAVLVTRGGGSKEDLWAFNEFPVAEAIVNCSVPVVAAIGHETDTTIAELVADERCATPTQAAMRLTPDRAALLRQIDASIRRLGASVSGLQREERHRLSHATMRLVAGGERQMSRRRERLGSLQRRLDRLHPRVLHAETLARVGAMATRLHGAILTRLSRESVEPAAQRLRRAMQVAIEAQVKEVAGARRALEAISPRRVLERGYSLTTDAQGIAVRDAGVLRAGDELVTTFASGSANSIVKVTGGEVPKNVVDSVPPVQKRRVTVELRPAGSTKPSGDQMGLF